jgi:hypothetical protein
LANHGARIVNSNPETKSPPAWATRFPAALETDYFGVDELRIEDLLALIAELAGTLQFRDGANRPAGTWAPFAQSDELFIIGRLRAVNLRKHREVFQAQFAAMRDNANGAEAWWDRITNLPTLELASILNEVHAQLSELQSVAAVRAKEKIENVIAKSLAAELQALKSWCAEFDEQRTAALFARFGEIWKPRSGKLPRPTPSGLLRDGFNAFYSAMQHLQGSLRAEFSLSLQRADHDPAVGLLLTALQLRQQVQKRLNGIAARQLAFYYDDILRILSRPVVPDRTILLLRGDSSGKEVIVPGGTLFSAGVDANRQERLYASARDLRVSDARVAELHSFWLERSAGVSPENELRQVALGAPTQPQYATSARIREIPAPAFDDSTVEGPRSSYSLFGHREANHGAPRGSNVPLGIAIASKSLAMKQGSREIRVVFDFITEEGGESIEGFVADLARILGTTEADAFFKAFRNAFHITVTEESGWYAFPDYLPTSACVDPTAERANSLGISLRLPTDAGAVVPASPAIHGAEYSGKLPIIRFVMNEAYLYLYSLFAGLRLANIRIDVEVAGCRDVIAYNQLGRLGTTGQLYPFGATPVIGNYLIVGSAEAAAKNLRSLELDIVWAALPTDAHGFAEHYRNYPSEYANNSFRARLSALAERRWLPSNEKDRTEVDLFDTRGMSGLQGAGPPSRRRRVDLGHLCKVLRPEEVGGDAFAYDVSTRSGFVRLTLSSPESGFGHRDYPMALSASVAANSKQSRIPLVGRLRKGKPPEPLPKPPYTPVIDSLAVNYSARDEIDLQYSSGTGTPAEQRIFHIHPLGLEPLKPGRPEGIHLVPWYREDGHLLIGIEARALHGPLTLFFDLKDDCRPTGSYREPNFHWYYLAGDEWRPLEPRHMLSDGTYGFLKPGVITLYIPPDATADNQLCPSGRYWLRISAHWNDVANVSSLHFVHAHGVEAIWQPGPGNAADHLADGLRAGTINQSKANLSGIRDVRQPLTSWGGKNAESQGEKIVRVSERLRHRQRAVTALDYEKLVLQEFSGLRQVRCFPNCSGDPRAPFATHPGSVFVVVLPQLAEGSAPDSGPMADAHELNEISRYIATLATGAASIRVSNPSYELIQVRCKVRLKQGQNPGDGIGAINRHLAAHLSPWSAEAKIPAFGWSIRCIDLQAYLQNLHVVSLATGVSALRIRSDGDGRQKLTDTARGSSGTVTPHLPWSVALPFRQHLIEVVDDSQAHLPSLAGFGNLAIGTTFIGTREGDD